MASRRRRARTAGTAPLIATLNSVCALAICRAASGAVSATRRVSGSMNGNTSATPSTLNAMCATATRRASAVERRLAANAAAQVPMFAPSTTGMAPSQPEQVLMGEGQHEPDGRRGRRHGRAQPRAPASRPMNGFAASATSTWRVSGCSASGARPSFITRMPRKRKPKPRMRLPHVLRGAAPARRSRQREADADQQERRTAGR